MKPSAADLKMIDLGALTWPITWRFRYRTPFGLTQHELTCDAPGVEGSIEASEALGEQLWRRSLAAAMVRDVEVIAVDTVMWKYGPAAFVRVPLFMRGLLGGVSGSRDECAAFRLSSAHNDQWDGRTMVLPAIPSHFVVDGLLTVGARGAYEQLAQAMIMGLCRQLVGSPVQWLTRYSGEVEPHAANPEGVTFRHVEFVSVAWHAATAPVPPSGPWPD